MSFFIEEESFGIVPLSKNDKGEWDVFLILHKIGNHWGFPKGHSHPGETPLETATRELKEETGLKVIKVLVENPFSEEYRFRKKGKFVLKRVCYFPAVVSGELNLQTEEIREGKWFSLEDAQQVLTFKEARSICLQLIKILR